MYLLVMLYMAPSVSVCSACSWTNCICNGSHTMSKTNHQRAWKLLCIQRFRSNTVTTEYQLVCYDVTPGFRPVVSSCQNTVSWSVSRLPTYFKCERCQLPRIPTALFLKDKLGQTVRKGGHFLICRMFSVVHKVFYGPFVLLDMMSFAVL